ncbi:hypothetical protein GIB67_007233, partial [Kingdonia uniflora]
MTLRLFDLQFDLQFALGFHELLRPVNYICVPRSVNCICVPRSVDLRSANCELLIQPANELKVYTNCC